VAAGLSPYAVGTETDGSISCPAAFNGCVGFKPTVGLVPTTGVVPISPSQDSPGPMATTVRDAAALLFVLAAKESDYASHAVGGRLVGKRIGVPRAVYWGYSPHADAAAERAVALLAAEGATIVDNADLPKIADSVWQDELVAWLTLATIAFTLMRAAGAAASPPARACPVGHPAYPPHRRPSPDRHHRTTSGPAPTPRLAVAARLAGPVGYRPPPLTTTAEQGPRNDPTWKSRTDRRTLRTHQKSATRRQPKSLPDPTKKHLRWIRAKRTTWKGSITATASGPRRRR